MSTVYNGFDPDQIDPVVPVRLDDHHCVLLHAGVFYGPRSPTPLLEGLKRFQEEDPAAAGTLRVAFVGPPTYEGQNLDDLARRHGVEALVRIILPVPYRKALAYLKGADVAVLFGQTGEGAVSPVPAKTYEYIGAGKPVLAIGTGEEAIRVMQQGGCRVWPVRAGDPAGMAAALREIAAEHRRNPVTGSPDSAKRLEFTREHMSESLESLLQSAIDSARTRDKTRTMNSR
jgi:glycosyltransferase involved in cell wall biosynthesis